MIYDLKTKITSLKRKCLYVIAYLYEAPENNELKLGKKVPTHVSEKYLRWLAGFFDGEGSVTITKRDELYVAIGGNFVEILKEPKERFGGYVSPPRGKRKKARQWQLAANKALMFLEQIQDYVKVKKEEIGIGVKFQRNRIKLHRGISKDTRQAQLQWRGELRERLRLINRVRKIGKRVNK